MTPVLMLKILTHYFTVWFLLLLAAILFVNSAYAGLRTQTIAGNTAAQQVTIIDGDTIEIAKERIRLRGIDTPEPDRFK